MSSPLITLTFTSTYNPLSSFSATFQKAIQGAQGDSYTFEGAWAAGTYAEFSVVSHNDAIWAALRSTAVEPSAGATADWALVADFSGATAAAAAASASEIAAAASEASASSSAGTATTQAGIAATQAAAALVSRNAADADAAATAADLIAVNAAGPVQIANIDAAGATQIGLVQAQGTTSITAVAGQGTTSIAAVAAQGVTSAALVTTEGNTQVSRITEAYPGNTYASTADALSSGVSGVAVTAAGSGGTNGTFLATLSGGAGSGAVVQFVVSGGAVVSARVLLKGKNYTSAPTASLAASSGLTGATLTLSIATNEGVGSFFAVTPAALSTNTYDLYENVASVATSRGSVPSSTTVTSARTEYDTRLDRIEPTSYVFGPTSPATGTNGGSATYIIDRPLPAGRLMRVQIYAGASATVKIKRFSRNGLTFTFIEEISVSVVAGLNTFTFANSQINMTLAEGNFLAFYSATAGFVKYNSVANSSGTEYYSAAGDNTTTHTLASYSTLASTTVRLELNVEVLPNFNLLNGDHRVLNEVAAFDRYVGPTSPASSGTTLDATVTYVERQIFRRAQSVRGITAYARLGCAVSLYIWDSNGDAGWTLARTVPLRLASGANTLVSGIDFPDDVYVKAGGLIGFRVRQTVSLDSDVFDPRNYDVINGEPGGTLTAFDSSASSFSAQIRFQMRDLVSDAKVSRPKTYLYNQSFTTVLGNATESVNWSISGGAAVASATGLANYLRSRKTAYYDCNLRVEFAFTGGSDEIAIFRQPSNNGTLGTILTINRSTGLIAFRAAWSGNTTLPATSTTKTTSLTLATNRRYQVNFKNLDRTLVMTITDMVTGDSDTLSKTTLTTAAGYGAGRAGVASITGAPAVYKLQFAPLARDPLAYMLGDSITQGSGGSTSGAGWAQLVKTALSGRALVSAHSGDGATAALARAEIELREHDCAYAIVFEGTNDTAAISTWQDKMTYLNRALTRMGVVPIYCTLIPQAAVAGVETTMNPWLRTTGWRLINVDYEMTTGATGLAADLKAASMADTLHPNDTGHTAIYNRVRLDLPELFELV